MSTENTPRQPHTKLTDHEVECLRWQHEVLKWGYKVLTKWWGISRTQVRQICNYKQR